VNTNFQSRQIQTYNISTKTEIPTTDFWRCCSPLLCTAAWSKLFILLRNAATQLRTVPWRTRESEHTRCHRWTKPHVGTVSNVNQQETIQGVQTAVAKTFCQLNDIIKWLQRAVLKNVLFASLFSFRNPDKKTSRFNQFCGFPSTR